MKAFLSLFAVAFILFWGVSDGSLAQSNVEELADDTTPVSKIDGDTIRQYILENPEIIREALILLEQRRLLEEARADERLVEAFAGPLFEDGYSFVGGNPDGDITLVEFQDYRCGFCKRAHSDVQRLVAEDGDIRLVIKEFPILGPDSLRTAQLAIAALMTEGPEAYHRFSDALMTYGGPINDAALDRLARSADVDLAKLEAEASNPEIERRIMQTRALAQQMSIDGTPTFVIGNRLIRGFLPYEEMQEMVALLRQDRE